MINCIKRINNIGFQKATYLGNEPEKPDYYIVYIYKNELFGKDKTGEFIQDGFGMYVRNNAETLYPTHYDEAIFKNEEACFVIASLCYDEHEPCWEIKSVGSRLLGLKDIEINDFWEIMRFGFEYLKKI